MSPEGKTQVRDDAGGQVGQPMLSLRLQPNSGNSEECPYLTNLCETRNTALGAVPVHRTLSAPLPKTEEKKWEISVFLKPQTASLAPRLPCQGQIQILIVFPPNIN